MSNFYMYIVKCGESYRVLKDNVCYGMYHKLTDALYERDRLMKVNWDWDLAVELPETKNEYEHMYLPKFGRDYQYITHKKGYWKVYRKYQYLKKFDDYQDAVKFADEVNGRIVKVNPKWVVQKWIDGQTRHFASCDSYDEAVKLRDHLIENNWGVDDDKFTE